MKNPEIIILIAVPFLAACVGVYLAASGLVSVFDLSMCVAGVVLTQFGVTFGYHRLVVHKSYQAHPTVKATALALGSMALQGPVVNWASVHTAHHAHSDHEGDPHSPTLGGFIHAHFEWPLSMRNDELNQIKDKWADRYMKDPYVRFFSRTFVFWTIVGLLVPAILGYAVNGITGAATGFLWGGLIRVFITAHVTWSVNSVCHFAGKKMFKTRDDSRNNFLIGLLALGEGWHNNHHAFPASAFHGMRWWQIDVTGWVVWLLEKVGLVRNVIRIPRSVQAKQLADVS